MDVIKTLADGKKNSQSILKNRVYDIASLSAVSAYFAYTFLSFKIEDGVDILAILLGGAMFYLTYMLHHILKLNQGKGKGRKDEAYTAANSALAAAVAEVQDTGDVALFRIKCKMYSDKLFTDVKHGILFAAGLSYDEYKARFEGVTARELRRDKSVGKRQKKAILQANRLKYFLVTPDYLFDEDGSAPLSRDKTEGEITGSKVAAKAVLFFVPTVLFNLFSAAFLGGEWVSQLLFFVLQVGLLIIDGILAEVDGYIIIAEDMRRACVHKADRIKEILKYPDPETGIKAESESKGEC